MERYSIQIKLKSYNVNKKLVQMIAGYIDNRISMLFQEETPKSILLQRTSICICHVDRSTEIKPIADYIDDHFNSAIESLSIEFEHVFGPPGAKKGIDFRISFGKEMQDNSLSLTLADTGAREKLIGIKDGLLTTLEYYRNNNMIVYPDEYLPTAILIAAILLAVLATGILLQPWRSVLASLSGICLYFFLHRYLKGYCIFDTARQKRLDIIYIWMATGIAGFILTSILTLIKKIFF